MNNTVNQKIDNWYNAYISIKLNGENQKNNNTQVFNEKIIRLGHKVPDKYKFIYQEKSIIEIDSLQAIIKVEYYCESLQKPKDKSSIVLVDTYYYDEGKTPLPLLVKSESNLITDDYSKTKIKNDFSIIEFLK